METPKKIALVTGSSRGLGKATALSLADRGVDVVVTYRSQEDEAQAVVQAIEEKGRRAVALQLDCGDVKSFEGFAARLRDALAAWGVEQFDYLVNNAGVGLHASFADTTEEQFDEMLNVHFKGVFFLTQKLLPLIADGGRIVNLSSGLARFSFEGSSAYASMKGAIEVLTRYLAKELGPRRITANVVAPGAIATDFSGGMVRDNQQLNQQLASQTALGRVGVAEDIGPMIAALLSEDNRWVNGQRIEVTGGFLL